MWSLVPGKIAALGNVMGGRKLARYVLEAVVGRCADAFDTVYHFSARNVKCVLMVARSVA
jgi:hypothetical protein